MAEYTGKNIFEKIGSFIPGYKGYSEKEGRRDTDKSLRMEIAKHIDSLKNILNKIIRQQTEQKKIEHINDIDRIKRNLDLIANQIRFANYGECGFFDVAQVDAKDLDKLYLFDLELKEETDKLTDIINKLQDSTNLKQDCSSTIDLLSALSEKISNRDKVIMEVR